MSIRNLLLAVFTLSSQVGGDGLNDGCACNKIPYLLKIGSPRDGSTVEGPFSIRIDYANYAHISNDEVGEGSPTGFELSLDGQPALQNPLSNRSKSFYIVNVGGLEKGPHVIEVTLMYDGADIPGSPQWMGGSPQVSDRVHFSSRGSDPLPPPTPHVKVPGRLHITLRKRVQHGANGQQRWPCDPTSGQSSQPISEEVQWHVNETAILVLDMWKFHGCAPAALRVAALATTLNAVLIEARERGVMVIHAPSSGVEEMAPEYPAQRARMVAAAAACAADAACAAATAHLPTHAGQSVEADPSAEPPLPFAPGCDDGAAAPPPPWDDETHAQHPAVAVFPADGLSDSAREIVAFLRAHGLTRVVLAGVHANECLLRRPFAARGLAAAGVGVAVARDLTDVLYDPREPPGLSRARARELAAAHLEAYVAPTLHSRDLLRVPSDSDGGPAAD